MEAPYNGRCRCLGNGCVMSFSNNGANDDEYVGSECQTEGKEECVCEGVHQFYGASEKMFVCQVK